MLFFTFFLRVLLAYLLSKASYNLWFSLKEILRTIAYLLTPSSVGFYLYMILILEVVISPTISSIEKEWPLTFIVSLLIKTYYGLLAVPMILH